MSSLLGGGLSLASSVLGGKGAKDAARTQQASLEEAQAKAQGLLQPYSDAGQSAINPLLNELGIGDGQAYQNPLLQQIQEQAGRQINQQMAASGQRYSGDAQQAIAQGMLQPAYNMQQQRIGNLMGLMGQGQGAAGAQAGVTQSFAGPIAQAGSSVAAAPYMAAQQGLNQLGGFAGMMGRSNMQAPSYQSTASPAYSLGSLGAGGSTNTNAFSNMPYMDIMGIGR